MKVLLCLHSFEPGGVERDVLRLATAWRAAGVDARIALGRREGVLEREAPDLPYFVMQQGGFSTARFETLWMIMKLPGVIRRFRPDILFCASNGLMAVAVAMKLLLGKRCPALVLRVSNKLVPTGTGAIGRSFQRLVHRAQRRTYAAIVAMAEPLRAEILEEFAIDPARVVVIDNASLTEEAAQHFAATRDTMLRRHQGRRYVAVGRLAPQKNFALLINAFALIARPEDRLTIIGEGQMRPRLEEQARRLGVGDRVDMPGHSFEPWRCMAESDVFVLSSNFEGLPAVVVEALAAGLPIVATDCAPSIPMLVEGAGRIVPIRDAAALASAMDTVLETPVDVAAMRARATRFTTEATTAQWLALFEAVRK